MDPKMHAPGYQCAYLLPPAGVTPQNDMTRNNMTPNCNPPAPSERNCPPQMQHINRPLPPRGHNQGNVCSDQFAFHSVVPPATHPSCPNISRFNYHNAPCNQMPATNAKCPCSNSALPAYQGPAFSGHGCSGACPPNQYQVLSTDPGCNGSQPPRRSCDFPPFEAGTPGSYPVSRDCGAGNNIATLQTPDPYCPWVNYPAPYVCRPVYNRKCLADCPEQDGPPADSYTFL